MWGKLSWEAIPLHEPIVMVTAQSAFQTLENSFLTSAFTPATFSSDNVKGLVAAMEYYLLDINQKEPAILQLYGQVLPEVDQAVLRSNTR